MKSNYRYWLFGVVGCFALVAWGLMTVPGTTIAKGKPGGNNGGGPSPGTRSGPCIRVSETLPPRTAQ